MERGRGQEKKEGDERGRGRRESERWEGSGVNGGRGEKLGGRGGRRGRRRREEACQRSCRHM